MLQGQCQSLVGATDATRIAALTWFVVASVIFLKMTPPLTTVYSHLTHHEHHNTSVVDVQEDNADRHHTRRDSALPSLSAFSRSNSNGKRHAGGNESGGENEDRVKFQRISEQPNKLGQNIRELPCPFHIQFPHRHDFKKCGTWKTWKAFREHLVSRTHRPQEQCPECGKRFDCEKWDVHTRARECQKKSLEEIETLICMTRDQETKIRALVTQGKKKKPFEELWRDVWDILFEGESCTTWPYSNDVNDSRYGTQSITDPCTLLGDQSFLKTVSTLPGIQNVPEKDRGGLAIRCWAEVQRWMQSQSVQNHVDAAGRQVPVAESARDNDAEGPRSLPSSSEAQASQMSTSNSFQQEADMADMLGVMWPDSRLFDGEGVHSQAGRSSSPSQYLPDPSGIIETVSADSNNEASVHNFYSQLPCVDPTVLANPNPQPTEPSSSNHNSSQLSRMAPGLPSSPVKHQDNMTTLSESSQSQYFGRDGCTNDGDTFDTYFFEDSNFSNGGISEQD